MVPSKRGLNVLPELPSLNQISYDFMIMKITEDKSGTVNPLASQPMSQLLS